MKLEINYYFFSPSSSITLLLYAYSVTHTHPTFQTSTRRCFDNIRRIYTNIQAQCQGNTDSFHLKWLNAANQNKGASPLGHTIGNKCYFVKILHKIKIQHAIGNPVKWAILTFKLDNFLLIKSTRMQKGLFLSYTKIKSSRLLAEIQKNSIFGLTMNLKSTVYDHSNF